MFFPNDFTNRLPDLFQTLPFLKNPKGGHIPHLVFSPINSFIRSTKSGPPKKVEAKTSFRGLGPGFLIPSSQIPDISLLHTPHPPLKPPSSLTYPPLPPHPIFITAPNSP